LIKLNDKISGLKISGGVTLDLVSVGIAVSLNTIPG